MAAKKYSAEEIVETLRQIDLLTSLGRSVGEALFAARQFVRQSRALFEAGLRQVDDASIQIATAKVAMVAETEARAITKYMKAFWPPLRSRIGNASLEKFAKEGSLGSITSSALHVQPLATFERSVHPTRK
jgi:hypothetical protein